METLIERATFMLELVGGSQTELANIAGVRPPSVNDWLSGKTKSIQIEPATRLAERFGLSPMWVAKGKLPKLSPSSDTQPSSIKAESNAEEGPAIGRLLRIPVVGMAQLGDNGYWAELETPVGFGDGFIPFPAKSRDSYALRCRGDSMKPRIKNGEFVIVDPSMAPAPGDEVLVKAKDGRVMVKELLYVRDDVVHLLSVNEAHGKLAIGLAEIEFMHQVAGIMPAHTWVKA